MNMYVAAVFEAGLSGLETYAYDMNVVLCTNHGEVAVLLSRISRCLRKPQKLQPKKRRAMRLLEHTLEIFLFH